MAKEYVSVGFEGLHSAHVESEAEFWIRLKINGVNAYFGTSSPHYPLGGWKCAAGAAFKSAPSSKQLLNPPEPELGC